MALRDLLFAWGGSFGTLFILSILWLSGLLSDDDVCTVERIEEEPPNDAA